MANQLEQLKKYTKVVADTGDIDSIEQYRPQDATTNPSLLQKAAKMPAYAEIVAGALKQAREKAGAAASPDTVVDIAIDRLSVEFGLRILKIVPGRVSTEVDARLSYDTQGSIDKARSLIAMYEAAGVARDRVLIKIASTWEGIRAAEVLEKEGIHCNLTLLFGLHQAIACAEAGVTLISPFVGRIYDYFKKKTGKEYAGQDDPGVQNVTEIYNYFKRHGHATEVMGASFRNTGQILELAGCDLLTISPELLEELHAAQGSVPQKLDAAAAKKMTIDAIAMDEATFRKMHEADDMASFKLTEGIEGFTKSLVELEEQLKGMLRELPTASTAP